MVTGQEEKPPRYVNVHESLGGCLTWDPEHSHETAINLTLTPTQIQGERMNPVLRILRLKLQEVGGGRLAAHTGKQFPHDSPPSTTRMAVTDGTSVLLLDIGSSRIRAGVWTAGFWKVEALTCVEMPRQEGGVHSADCVVRLCVRAISSALASHARKGNLQPTILACTSFVGSCCACERDSLDLGGRQLLTYAFDGGPSQAITPTSESGWSWGLDWMASTGTRASSSSYLAGMSLTLCANAEGLQRPVLMSIGGLILREVCGADAHVSISEASWLGVMDIEVDPPALVGVKSALALQAPPTLQWCLGHLAALSDVPSTPTPPGGLHIPHLSGLPCIGDGAAASLGSHALAAASGLPAPVVAVSIGTTAAVRVIVPLPSTEGQWEALRSFVQVSGGWAYRISSNALLVGAALTDGGAVLDDVTALLSSSLAMAGLPLEAAEACIQGALGAIASQGQLEGGLRPCALSCLPAFGGERFPSHRPRAAGVLAGLSRSTGLQEHVQGRMQGVAFHLAIILDHLTQVFPALASGSCVGSGGALEHSHAWQHVLACALNRSVFIPTGQGSQGRGAPSLTALGLMIHAQTCISDSAGGSAFDICALDPARLWDTLAGWQGDPPQLTTIVPAASEGARHAWKAAKQAHKELLHATASMFDKTPSAAFHRSDSGDGGKPGTSPASASAAS